VTVVEVAGTRVYVRPGAKEGVHRNTKIVLRGKEYPVIEATDSFAVVDVGSERFREQEKGRATRVSNDAPDVVELPKPHPLETWEHALPPQAPLAEGQQPRFVPLGEGARDRRYDVQLSVFGGASVPLGSRQLGNSLAMGELAARVHVEPFSAPVRFDADASLRGWAASDLASRVGGPTRSTVFVRELLASYASGGWYGGFGRMRYAASTLGTLDGARGQAPLGGGFSLGAFGGALPDPSSGAPSLRAQRFGVEASFARPDLGLRPEGALVAHASTFGGALDERRLSGVFSLFPGTSRFGGHFELSSFDANNPWRQPSLALTSVGLDSSVRAGVLTIGARADLRQPEMSRWLASFYPASWFCTTVPQADPTLLEPCNGDISMRAFGEIDANVEVDRYSLTLGGTTVKDLGQSNAANMTGVFAAARVVKIAGALRFDASGSYSRATYIDMVGGTAGPGITLLDDALDISAYYRLNILQYRSLDSSFAQNGAGATVAVFPNAVIFFTFQGEATTGDDVSALWLFASATWRPRF
jgi:hypothetical protein